MLTLSLPLVVVMARQKGESRDFELLGHFFAVYRGVRSSSSLLLVHASADKAKCREELTWSRACRRTAK